MGNEARAEKLAAWYENELREVEQRVRAHLRAATRLLRARRPRPADRRQGLDQRRGARVPRRAQRRRRSARRAGHRVVRAGDPVGPGGDPHHRSEFLASVWTDPRWRAVKAVAAKRVYLSPHLPFGWFDFPPGANRLLGVWWAGQAALSEGLPTSTCAPRSPSSTACSITTSRPRRSSTRCWASRACCRK